MKLCLPLLLAASLFAQEPPPEPPAPPEPAEMREVYRGDVVNFGRTVTIERGERAGSVVCIGCSIYLRGPAQDVVAILGSVYVEGGSASDVVAVGGSVELDGEARGDLAAIGGRVVLRPGASVIGDLAAIGGGLERDPTATVTGDIAAQHIPLLGTLPLGLALLVLFLAFLGAFNLVLVAVCYPIAGRARVLTLAQAVRLQPGPVLLAGLGACVFAFILLSLAGFMGPAGFFLVVPLALVMFVALVLGYTGLSFWLGNRIAPGNHPFVLVLLGALIISIVQVVPLLGQAAMLFFLLLALGAVAWTGFGGRLDWLQRQYRPAPVSGSGPPPPAPQG
jgi:hypothetical protein